MIEYKILITISHYNQRSKDNLNSLVSSLKTQNSDLYIVINDDNCIEEKNGVFQNIKTKVLEVS